MPQRSEVSSVENLVDKSGINFLIFTSGFDIDCQFCCVQ